MILYFAFDGVVLKNRVGKYYIIYFYLLRIAMIIVINLFYGVHS